MKLIHYSEITGPAKGSMISVPCRSGMDMNQLILKIQQICKKNKNKSTVVWDSRHHEIVLWVEDKKYESYFLLLIERGS